MPVTINGDGSITGLSVGGLGSGVVNTATLADGAAVGSKLGAGSVIQAVSATTTSTVQNTTDTYADTGLSATINISAGSKVLIMCVLHLDVERSSSTNSRCAIKLLRGSTDIFAPPSNKNVGIEGASSGMVMFLPLHFSFLDTGASTGSNTYKLQGRVTSSGNSPRVRFQDSSNPSTMTLLEIAG